MYRINDLLFKLIKRRFYKVLHSLNEKRVQLILFESSHVCSVSVRVAVLQNEINGRTFW